MERMYLNAHTHGIEPHPHIDDGDYTIIYYPRMDWKENLVVEQLLEMNLSTIKEIEQ